MKKKLLCRILSLLGFAVMLEGCSDTDDTTKEPTFEYGVPSAEYEIKGKVTDTQNNPLKEIRVVIHHLEEPNELSGHYYYVDTIFTNLQGEYTSRPEGSRGYAFPAPGKMTVKVADIDGAENGGEFAEKSIQVEVKSGDFKGGKGWYQGKFEKTVDFVLEEKKAVQE